MVDLKLFAVFLLSFQLSLSEHPCKSSADCANTDCCVSNFQPIGRRKRAISTGLFSSGHCESMGQKGNHCYVRQGSASTPPTDPTWACPCLSPLTCVGSNMFEIPQGEVGTCE